MQEETLFTIASGYYGVLQATTGLDIHLTSVKRMEKHKKQIVWSKNLGLCGRGLQAIFSKSLTKLEMALSEFFHFL